MTRSVSIASAELKKLEMERTASTKRLGSLADRRVDSEFRLNELTNKGEIASMRAVIQKNALLRERQNIMRQISRITTYSTATKADPD